MHHSGGAFTETCYVYLPLCGALAAGAVPQSALVVGLGLGYIECMTAASSLAAGRPMPRLESFEADEALREAFRGFILSNSPFVPVGSPLSALHQAILEGCARLHGVDAAHLRAALAKALAQGNLILNGALDVSFPPPVQPYGAAFFDAYSEATSVELWSDEMVARILRACAPECAFATYASRTRLKKLLHRENFNLVHRRGFKGKRECTLAWRG
jgi:tRNA U34 5-methylaminomethyl-2-thiouridine-forming methyltransferase MnmC